MESGAWPRPTPPDERALARRREVGEQIRRVREHHNLIQLEVRSRSGVDVATYSRIEQGHASPLLDTLIRIADAMACTSATSWGDPPPTPGGTDASGGPWPPR
ncbi:hypothetical protein GCM10023080_009990 [Streptomyces pseudoechinosporeus]